MGMTLDMARSADKKEMIALIRKAVERGITFFDTAQVYGPFTNEELVGEALTPFRGQVVIATKFGMKIDTASGQQVVDSQPEYIKQSSLDRLKVDAIDLFYQHRVRSTSADRRRGRGSKGPDSARQGQTLRRF